MEVEALYPFGRRTMIALSTIPRGDNGDRAFCAFVTFVAWPCRRKALRFIPFLGSVVRVVTMAIRARERRTIALKSQVQDHISFRTRGYVTVVPAFEPNPEI